MYNTIVAFLTLMIVLSACIKSEKADTIIDSTDCEAIYIDPLETVTVNRSDLYEITQVIQLEDPIDNVLGNINDLVPINENLVVNSNGIFVYSDKGKFLREIGASGKGPGEYLSKHISGNRNKIVLTDRSQNKIIEYSLENGTLISEKITGIWGQSIANWNGFKVVYGGTELTSYNDKLFFFEAETNRYIDSFFELKEYEWKYINFFDKTNFFTFRDSLRFLYSFDNTVYSIHSKEDRFSISKRYCIDFNKHEIPKDFFQPDAFTDVLELSQTLRETNYAFRIMGFFETDQSVMFMFQHGSKLRMALYSKKEKEVKVIEHIADDVLFEGVDIEPRDEFFSYYFGNDKIYHLIYPYEIIELLAEKTKNGELDSDEKTRAFVQTHFQDKPGHYKMDPDGNPFIFVYELTN